MDTHRAQRVSEALREELAEIIEYELLDPRLAGVTVTDVQVTPDLRHAHVLVAPGRDAPQAAEALEHARQYLRRELSGRLRLFRVPELHFEAESAGGRASRVEELLERVRKGRSRSGPGAGGAEKNPETRGK